MQSIIRNAFIRSVALFERIWKLFSQLFGQLFKSLGQVFGLSSSASNYFAEEERSNSANQITSAPAQPTSSQSTSASKPTASVRSTPRRSGTEMDYFRNMARQVKKP
ncbi:hypothetical protein IFO70_23085 [Phormidium tenue FACHB-886]|nr:hypothetical protein [Phormidium tenue FACHB-886]